jgi:hypothetical protein
MNEEGQELPNANAPNDANRPDQGNANATTI